MLASLLFINGTFQATAWPNCVKALSSWYSNEHRASIFGLWGTCIFVGGVVGTSLTVYLQYIYSPKLEIIFIIPSLIVFIIGILVFFTLKTPSELDIDSDKGTEENLVENLDSPNVLDVCRLEKVPELLVAVICVKLVRYSLYMWLPLYLYEALNYSKAQAGMLSITFEIGGVLGSSLLGLFINR